MTESNKVSTSEVTIAVLHACGLRRYRQRGILCSVRRHITKLYIESNIHKNRLNFDTGGTPDHLLLDSVPNLGPLISRWEINELKNC
jgi:hypothetical protein